MQARFFDGRQAQPHPATLSLADGMLTVRDAGGTLLAQWPFRKLRIATEPGNRGIVRFPGEPGVLAVDDPATVAALYRAARRRPRRVLGWKLSLAGCLAAVILLALLVDAAPGLLAPLVPRAWEEPLGRWSEASVLRGHRRCTGPAGQAALEDLLIRLGQAGGLGRTVRVVVADDGTVNAFALPGDRIVLPRGMIDGVADGDELAGVLAHEMGHIVHRDATRGVLRSIGLQMVGAGLGWGGVGSGGVVGSLANLSYGRAAETQADAFAVTILRRLGLRADGLGRFLAHAGHGPDLPAFLSDHPASAEREARTAVGSDGDPAFDQTEWLAIRSMCR